MTEVKPFVKCVDFWPGQIQENRLKVYKEMISEGQIMKHHVIFNQQTGSTTVEYSSIAPHEWILEQMKARCS